jgi:hypothetical protein
MHFFSEAEAEKWQRELESQMHRVAQENARFCHRLSLEHVVVVAAREKKAVMGGMCKGVNAYYSCRQYMNNISNSMPTSSLFC